MSFAASFIKIAKKVLPSPFSIAIILTVITALLALLLTEPKADTTQIHILQIAQHWETGFWELLKFTMQMMLILILGHVLALSQAVNKLIDGALRFCTNTAKAAFMVSLLSMVVALVNWGLGLVFGAIFARKVGEFAQKNNIKLNYPLIGAAGYAGLMVWHGGLSGSAPLTITESSHFLVDKMGVVPLSETIFSSMNIFATIAVLVIIPAAMYWMGKNSDNEAYPLNLQTNTPTSQDKTAVTGAERIDYAHIVGYLLGGTMLTWAIYKAIKGISAGGGLSFLTLNYINFLLFGLGVLLHKNIHNFLQAVNTAIGGSTGIMIQFPLYAGIMGIMKYSGLIEVFSGFFVQISSDFTFPIFTFISAGIVNVFVPSGGGQWAVQGPIIVEAAQQLGVSINKCVMALAYGDQLTNMMQPFWALPLLGITGLKANEILPYTLFLLLLGSIIFITTLLLF
jgi:short-chain fatty acids transporter